MARNEPANAVVLTATASTIVSAVPTIVTGVVLAPATVSCTVALYDNAATSTSVKLVLAGAAAGDSPVYHSDGGIIFDNGVVAVVTGSDAQATVVYSKIF